MTADQDLRARLAEAVDVAYQSAVDARPIRHPYRAIADAVMTDSALLDDICEYRAHQLNEEGRPIRDDLCWSTGPRVGDEGRPYCLLPLGHTGLHISHPESGFLERWGDPALRASASDRENAWLPEDGDSDA